MYLFYKAGVVLSYIEVFTAVSARSHNMSQKNSLPIVAEIKPSKLGRSPKNEDVPGLEFPSRPSQTRTPSHYELLTNGSQRSHDFFFNLRSQGTSSPARRTHSTRYPTWISPALTKFLYVLCLSLLLKLVSIPLFTNTR